MSLFLPLLRLTGYFEGNRFHPVSIDRGSHLSYDGWTTDIARLADLDSQSRVEWKNILTAEAPEGRTLETIYAWDPGGYYRNEKPVSSNGQHFDSLTELLHGDKTSGDPFSLEKRSLAETVLISRADHEDTFGAYQIAVAIRCRPLLYAAMRLLWVYLISFAIVLLILLRTRKTLMRQLTDPLERLTSAVTNGTTITRYSGWYEPGAMEQYYIETHETLAQNQTDLLQLRTALDYARDAEENRKQLISNITHELKTPLAIIHSYAECLCEGVAPEKREQYLNVILEESERMDAMVVQMLDLSRLEAGKVRLAADSFSLLELTMAIAERFEPLLAPRELTMQFDLAQDFRITADEGRIGQAITNLLSNALKYTTRGGIIRIKLYLDRSGAYFALENTAPHLSEEALEKVYDSFYRADPSRNTPGTGLGLALVRTIVGLHGGNCFVRNTLSGKEGAFTTGVEFGFRLPLT